MNWKDSRWLRTVRRFAVVFLAGVGSSLMLQTGYSYHQMLIILATALVCGFEKYVRETKKE